MRRMGIALEAERRERAKPGGITVMPVRLDLQHERATFARLLCGARAERGQRGRRWIIYGGTARDVEVRAAQERRLLDHDQHRATQLAVDVGSQTQRVATRRMP